MEQAPPARIVTVAPDTVHTAVVVEVKLTGSPELAEALMVKGATPKVTLASELKVIVCDIAVTVKLRATLAAAL
jgi:hypothetical protein